jgi:cytohesin
MKDRTFLSGLLVLVALAFSSLTACVGPRQSPPALLGTPHSHPAVPPEEPANLQIHAAADSGDLAKVKAMLRDNPELVFSTNSKSLTPLHVAALKGHKDVAELLLTNNAGVNAKNYYGRTPLHFAAAAGHKDVVELLLAHGADVNVKDNCDQTPLHMAAQQDQKDTVELLLANNADVNAKDYYGQTPLHMALGFCPSEDVADLLRQHGGHE